MDVQVAESRLREDIEANAEFGAVESEVGRGRTVLTGTKADRQARERLVEQLEAVGMEVRVDRVGNIAGRWTPARADPDAAPIAAGSHLDSVPRGGIFDGPLGTYAALEAVRAMQDAGAEPERPIEVVSFTEEEGTSFSGLLGSAVAAGALPVEEALALTNGNGTTLEEALSEIGFQGEGTLDPSSWDAWLELHIEQDTRLEREGVPIGVVTTITGISHGTATVEGEANHAGATPMGERQDALAAAAEVILDVEAAANEIVETESETAVGTVGKLNVTPNATNVVPGGVELGIDVRDIREESIERIHDAIRESLDRVADERDVETAYEESVGVPPVPMSDRLREEVHAAGDRTGIETIDLHSGAAHDTMHVATVTDAALLFAPSRDGISHNPREWTDWEDCAAATQVMTDAIVALAGGN